jgi:deazaflavin-dependent oxidoreductase (nitroreductase family)
MMNHENPQMFMLGELMTEHEEIVDSPVKWVAKHIRRYVETDGKDGGLYQGMPTLLLTTRGRKSGKLYRTALIYGEDNGRYLLIPSNGGSSEHPSWYLNLSENPAVEVQVGADKFSARARIANTDEKPALWQIMTKIFPRYNTYQKQAGREIPVVILERN